METWEWITLATVAGAALVLVLAVLAVAAKTDDGEGESTENLRKAMVDFRSVLDELVGSGEPAAT